MAFNHCLDVLRSRLSSVSRLACRHPDLVRRMLGRVSRSMKDRFGAFPTQRLNGFHQLGEIIP